MSMMHHSVHDTGKVKENQSAPIRRESNLRTYSFIVFKCFKHSEFFTTCDLNGFLSSVFDYSGCLLPNFDHFFSTKVRHSSYSII